MKDKNKTMDITFYRKMLATSLSAGLPVISTDTAARILSVICVLGNNEHIVLSPKVQADVEYMMKRFHIEGAEAPSPEIVPLLQQYLAEVDDAALRHTAPEWAVELFNKRYGIPLYY